MVDCVIIGFVKKFRKYLLNEKKMVVYYEVGYVVIGLKVNLVFIV